MADLRKSSFKEDLDKYQVLIQDTDPNSKYFKITELPDTFTGGKNAFLIAGSEYLVPDTLVKIEIKDASGNVIYSEPGEGMLSTNVNNVPTGSVPSTGSVVFTEYYEGTSKVVAVYVYPDTAFGPCTITILGELSSYDNNGTNIPIPTEWQNAYNVKWQKQINVNPALPNTTKIRFYRRPKPTITESVQPIYQIISGSKVNTGVYQSFANVKLSNLETFAGDVKRVKVFRTSQGDISDYDLIQDILVESKELLTTYDLSGSVVGETGIFTSETFPKFWNTGSLKAELTSSRVESGVKLSGSGYFTYTSSLDIKSGNTYELNLDAFYSSSTSSNLGIYLSQVTTSIENNVTVPIIISSSIATLVGTQPTKNLLDTTIPFKLDRNYPTASLYFSQSQGEWHLGNISLKLAQDTAFSPDEISFITTMPTVVGNETYNFKFEFYDVNNNYVPVFVTQSALFTGGTNFNNIILSISSSVSESISGSSTLIYAVSQSISGTAALYLTSSVATASVFYTSSIQTSSVYYTASLQTSSLYLTASIATASYSASVVSASVYTLSGSVSSSIGSLSSSVSQSIYNGLLSSFQKVQQLADGGYSGSFISGNIIYAPVIGGQLGYFSTLFKVGQSPNSIFLDARTNTRKIYVGGVNDTGSYNSGSTSVYMDSDGYFSLKDKLLWDGTTLTVNGNINVTGGNVQTSLNNLNTATASLNTTTASINTSLSNLNTATGSLQTQITAADDKIFTNALGRIVKTPSTGTQAGLYLGNTNLGYYNGSAWKTYMDNTGLFYLTGSADGNALLWDGSNLIIRGTIKVGGGQEVTSTTISNAASALQSGQTGKSLGLTGGSVGGVTIASDKIYVGTGNYANTDTGFFVNSSGQMSLKDKLIWDGTTLTITGKIIITDGNAATTSSLNAGLATKISTGNAASDINNNTTTISGGKITTDTITATQISSLNFYGKTARFDTGDIGGWSINSNNIHKSGSTHVMTLDSAGNVFRIVDNLNGQLRVAITGSTSIPPIQVASTDTITFSQVGGLVSTAQTSTPNIPVNDVNNATLSPSSGRGDTCSGQGYTGTGVIGLIYPTEEIWVDVSEMTPNLFDSCVDVSSNDGYDDYVYGRYTLQLRVRKYANCSDAVNDTNVVDTYIRDIADIKEWYSYSGGGLFNSDRQISVTDCSVQVNSNNNYFRVDLLETSDAYVSPGSYQTSTTSAFVRRFNGSIVVRFGRVDNGYSVFGPGGLQVYQGVKSYLNASTAAAGENFFEVKGKSAFLSGLYVSGTFSAQNKQFQITHPLDDKKWLYHTSLEAPRADLIYRGVLQLENGEGSVSIDSASNMTIGTFDALTKNSQLFLQNNESFDRVRGYVQNGSVFILSENKNSTASIDWSVIAERNDYDLNTGPTYFNGKYKVERYKSQFADEIRLQIESGSI